MLSFVVVYYTRGFGAGHLVSVQNLHLLAHGYTDIGMHPSHQGA